MSDEKALIPIEEQKVDFYGDEIVAVSLEIHGQRKIYVPLRPICDYLGLSWSSQLQRLKDDEVLRAFRNPQKALQQTGPTHLKNDFYFK